MKKISLLLLGCLFLTTIVQAQEISSYSVYFETDRSNLQETAQQTLDELAAALLPLHLNDYQVEVEAQEAANLVQVKVYQNDKPLNTNNHEINNKHFNYRNAMPLLQLIKGTKHT